MLEFSTDIPDTLGGTVKVFVTEKRRIRLRSGDDHMEFYDLTANEANDVIRALQEAITHLRET